MKQMKNRKSNNGITLIALVITIIVLLILAAVSIAMLTGENGILKKASTAKEKHLIAQYEEELNLCIMEMQTDELGTLTMPKLIEKLPQYIQTSQPGEQYEWNTEQTSEEPTGTYKGYEFKVDKNKKAQITGKATGIMISCSVEPSEYTNKNVKATIKIICNEGIQSIKQTKPTEEEAITASGTEYTIVKENIGENTTFEYEVIDSKGNKDTKIAQVTNIDKDAPTNCTITANVNDDGVIEVTATAEDVESGIGRYECYANETKKGESTDGTFIIDDLETGTYSIYVIAYDKAENSKKSNICENIKFEKMITAKVVAKNPQKYYGKRVANYKSINGQNDWKIFYSDGEHIFLITGDYVYVANNTKLDTNNTKMILQYSNNYSVYGYLTAWDKSNVPSLQINKKIVDGKEINIDNEVKQRFKATGVTLDEKYDSSKCASTLLNTSNWESYKDSNGMAEYAIGGSTIEMWTESWNNIYPNDYIYCKKANDIEYSTSNSTDKEDGINVELKGKSGSNNSLYFNGASNSKCENYWLASPTYVDSLYLISNNYIDISHNSPLGKKENAYSKTGLRPVVSLTSKAKVKINE